MAAEIRTASPTLRSMMEIVDRSNFSRARLCAEADVNTNALWWWRTGRKEPGIINVEVMLDVLGYRLQIVRKE